MGKRKPTLSSLKKKAWSLLSEFVRRKDADEGGTTQCFTCGKYIHWKYEAQAGHAIGGRRNAVLYDLDISRPQCYPCNAKHIGNGRPEVFIPKLIREHSMEWWQEKETKARQVAKLTRDDVQQLIDSFKAKIESL